MLSDTSLRVDDLTPEEIATVAHAYLAALDEGEHETAFDVALESLRACRPQLPLNVAAAELEMLLAELPPVAAQAVAAQATALPRDSVALA